MILHFAPGFGAAAPDGVTFGTNLNPNDFLVQYINAGGDKLVRLRSITVSCLISDTGTPSAIAGPTLLPIWVAILPAPQASSIQVPQPVNPALFQGAIIYPLISSVHQARARIPWLNWAPALPTSIQYKFSEHEIVAGPTQQIVIAVSAPANITSGQGVSMFGTVFLSSLGWDESLFEAVTRQENLGSMARFGVERRQGFSYPPFVEVDTSGG